MNKALRVKIVLSLFILISATGITFRDGKLVSTGTAIASEIQSVWTDANESEIVLKGERRIVPDNYRTVRADLLALRTELSSVPPERSDRTPAIISLPMPDGRTATFSAVEYSMMDPGLSSKYPDIRTYLIQGISDPYASGTMDITVHGFHAMILSPKGDYFIDPYSANETEHYISYYKTALANRHSFECLTDEIASDLSPVAPTYRGAIVCGPELRTYRLAMAATGEYTTFHGGTVSQGLAAIVTAMNRVNGVYIKDLCIRMTLIANNDLIVYTNSSTDPYTNSNGGAMLSQNQNNLDNVIGSANYDIGHVFSTGGGGVAFLRCVCVPGIKAQGVTGLPQPTGDPFYIDYVAHEVGHQYGGNHTFNSEASACGGGNRNAGTAWEPGSGSTIMAYAGICGSHNLQNNSDDYFHTGSFSEIQQFIQFGTGNSCAVITNSGNTPPSITMPSGGWVLPVRTPFQLTGTATDAETPNSLTYCWEEMDIGPPGSPNSPSGDAPIFRSFKPDTSGTRYFPKLSNILNNTQTIGEILPTYSRNLTFRLTVRDNNATAGGVNNEIIFFTVDAAAGPFLVTYPNSAVTLNSNVPQTITWDVANTNAAPVNCANVNIKLSTDGGLTFPVTLAAGTPNDGSQSVTLPSINNTAARIKIEAVGNVFFDLSNTNFTISNQVSVTNNGTGIPEKYSLSQNFPNPFNPATRLTFALPENGNVELKVYDLSGKEVAVLVNGMFSAGSYSVNFDAGKLSSGVYVYVIRSGNFTESKRMTLLK